MKEFKSPVVKMEKSREEAYAFLSDFTNFDEFLAGQDKGKWESTADNCSISISGLPAIELGFAEKQPHERIVIRPVSASPIPFNMIVKLWDEEGKTAVQLMIEAELNAMMSMMVAKPLQNYLDQAAEKLQQYFDKQ